MEEWRKICEKVKTDVWEYETSDEEEIRDYFELDGGCTGVDGQIQ